MLYMNIADLKPGNRDAAQKRFAGTDGKPPPGITMVSRHIAVDGRSSYTLYETEDPVAMGKWIQEWSDLVSFKVVPVLTDDQYGEVIS